VLRREAHLKNKKGSRDAVPSKGGSTEIENKNGGTVTFQSWIVQKGDIRVETGETKRYQKERRRLLRVS